MKVQPWQLQQRQGQPLHIKEQLTVSRIKSYYQHFNGNVYVSSQAAKTLPYYCT